MANKGLKKLLALMCATAMVASAAPCAVFADSETEPAAQDVAAAEEAAESATAEDAEEAKAVEVTEGDIIPADDVFALGDTLVNWDYTGSSATADWSAQNGQIVATVGSGYLHVISSRDATRYAWKQLDSEITSNVLVTYKINITTVGAASTVFAYGSGTMPTSKNSLSAISSIEVNNSGTGTVNGTSVTFPNFSSNATGVMDVAQFVDFDNKQVQTTITQDSTTIYSGTDDFVSSSATSIQYAKIQSNKQNGCVDLYTFKATEATAPVITPEDGLDIFAGETKKIATVANASEISVDIAGSDFELVSTDNGEVYVKAVAGGTAGQTDITITAVGDVTVKKVITVTYATDETLVDAALAALDIASGNDNVTQSGDNYEVTGDFVLPDSINTAVISWSAAVDGAADESVIKIDGNNVTVGTIAEGQTVTLTATATSGDVTKTRTFNLLLPTAIEKLKMVIEAIDLSSDNSKVIKNSDGTYQIAGAFTVPLSDTETPQITYTWAVGESDADKLSVSGATVTPLVYDKNTATLTVTGTYKGSTYSRDFSCVLDNEVTYYDESFDSWESGQTLVKLNGDTENTDYDGWIFKVGSRSDGGNGGVYTTSDGSDVYLSMNAAFGDSSRFPRIILTKTPAVSDIANILVAEFKMQIANTECALTVDDGSESAIGSNTIVLDSTMGLETGKWYTVTIALNNPGTSAEIIIVDADGNLVHYDSAYSTALKRITSLDFNMRLDNYIYINDFSLKDTKYSTDPDVVVEAAAKDIDIPGDSANKNAVTTATKEGADFLAVSDFAIPTSAYGAAITWSCDDSHITIDNTTGKATVNPEDGYTGPVAIKATVSYEGATPVEVTYNVELQDPQVVLEAAEVKVVNVLDYKKQGEVQVDLTDSTTPVMYDLYLPTTGDTNVVMSWKCSEDIYTITGTDAVLMLSDTAAYNVTLTNTVSYVKNGVTLATKEYSYPITVKFDKDAATAKAQAAAQAMADAKNKKDPDAETQATADDYISDLMKALLYNYQVRFDTAYTANFSNVPVGTIATGTTTVSLPSEGLFGSTFVWESSNSAIKVQNSSSSATVTHPSSNTSVTLTASIGAGTADIEKKSFTVTVAGKGSSGGGGGGGGSTGRTSSSTTVTTTASPTATAEPDSSNPFTDIDNVKSWAGDAITKLYKNGIISGRSETIFDPDAPVTRAEFIKMLIGTLKIDSSVIETPIEFTDLDESHWAYDCIQIAAAAGIVNGYEDGSFGVNDNIFRQDMAVILKRAADYVSLTLPQVNEEADFTDESEIGAYAADAVTALQEADIINGNDDGSFNPYGAANRAQAAKVLAADVFWN